jgi:amino acid adenylation domain-containing protein
VLLDHIVWDEDGRLRIAWDAVDGALPEGFVGGMLTAHTRLLRRLAAEDDVWRDPALGWDPSFLADEPLDIAPFGDAGPLLDDPLRAMAEDAPHAPALLSAGASVTHGELAAAARRTGAALAAAGLGPDDLVAVAAEKGIPQVTALLGVAASGAGYVPVEPSWPADRVASLCAQAAVRHALATPGVDLAWPDSVTVHRLEPDGALTGLDETVEPSRAAPHQLAYAIFTSGSTGKPKGVAVEHRAVRTTLDDLADRFPLLPQDRVLGLSAFSFDLSVYDIFSVLGAGGAVVLPDADRQRDPGHWLELMARHRVTVWNTAPALMEMLVEYAEIDPEQARAAMAPLRLVLLSADWIPVGLPDRIRAIAPDAQVISLGGATEGSIWSICFPIGTVAPGWKSIPYGRALRGQSFHILDDAGRPCPVDVPGELHIGGDGLARGYVGDPEQTAHRFSDHAVLRRRLYRTGDLGRWRLDGTIEFLGRVDRQVKIRGHRIELGEVESVLERAPGVRNVVAKSVPGPDDRPRLVAYVVPSDPGRPPADDDLIAMLRRSVPDFMVPSRFVRMRRFPVTANGKIDYAELRNPYSRGGDNTATAPAVAPRPQPAEPISTILVQSTAAHSTVPAERAPAEPGDGRLEELLSTAAAEGLGLTLTLTAGALPPGEALAAAARCSDRIRRLAVTRGLPLTERLPDNGLLEMVLGAADPGLPPGPTAAPVPESAPADIPDPEVERAIARVLSDLLKAPVDVETPFFRLGATSLTLVLAHKRLAADLDPGLAVVDMFAHSTVRNLALLISRRRHGGGDATPAPASDSGGGTPPDGDGGPPPDSSGESPNARPSRRQARAIAAEVAR